MKKAQIFINKPVYLGLSILELKKNSNLWVLIRLCETKLWKKKAKLCYMDRDSSLVYIKTEDICSDISKDVETIFVV